MPHSNDVEQARDEESTHFLSVHKLQRSRLARRGALQRRKA